MTRKLIVTLIGLLGLAAVGYAQTETPPLTETWNGRGRLADVTFNYPTDWFTIGGVPVNRFISFNVISSVRVGLRNPLPTDEEAIVLAISGGYIDGWSEIEPEATPEDILIAFLERLGGESDFSGERPAADEQAALELRVEARKFNGYDAVEMRFVPAEGAVTPTPDADNDDFNGEFVAYALRLSDNRFLVALTLTAEQPFEDARPTIESVLESITFDE